MRRNAHGKLQHEENDVKRIKMKVEGITCSGCAVDVSTVLKNTDGILDADASYSTGDVNIDFDPRELNEKQVLDLIKKLGLKKIS
jgi:Cu+-exporting ATPase